MIKIFIGKLLSRFRVGILLLDSGMKWIFADNASQLRQTIGEIPEKSRPVRAILLWSKGCIFSKSDKNLVSWASQNFDGNIVLVINCDCQACTQENLPKEFLGHTILIRKNIGYDWGGYRDLLLSVGTSDRPFITIMNNSIVPLFPYSAFLDRQERLAMEIKGLTGAVESATPIRHLQSFCMTFSNQALNSGITEWLKGTKNVSSKWAMVYFREIQLCRIAKHNSIEWRALLSNDVIRRFSKNNFDIVSDYKDSHVYQMVCKNLNTGRLNPSHHLWRFLLELGFPFIKKELLRDNPANLPDFRLARSLVGKVSNV